MVDDDFEDIFLTKIICRRSSVPIEFTGLNSGAELYDLIKNHGIGSMDTILVDVNMPIEGGYSILKKLRNYPDISDVDIVMFSTSPRAGKDIEALGVVEHDFVKKPATPQDAGQFVEMLESFHSKRVSHLQLTG